MNRKTLLILLFLAFLYLALTERRRREEAELKLLDVTDVEVENTDADDDADLDENAVDWDVIVEMLESDADLVDEYNSQRHDMNFLEWVSLEHPEMIKHMVNKYFDSINNN